MRAGKSWTLYAAPLLVGAGAMVGVLALRGNSEPVAEVVPGSRPIVARPAPEESPEPVAAEGACGTELAAIRTLMEAVRSGSLLDDSQNFQLTRGMARVDDTCAADIATEFRDREITPWLTYLPPQV